MDQMDRQAVEEMNTGECDRHFQNPFDEDEPLTDDQFQQLLAATYSVLLVSTRK